MSARAIVELQREVSIPAPVKGATHPAPHAGRLFGVSIPAPVKGATKADRLLAGSGAVSIPAPVKGATGGEADDAVQRNSFNSCPREGGNSVRSPLW